MITAHRLRRQPPVEVLSLDHRKRGPSNEHNHYLNNEGGSFFQKIARDQCKCVKECEIFEEWVIAVGGYNQDQF